MKKLDKKYVEEYLNENGYNLLSDYNGNHADIIIERDGYKSKTSLSNFKANMSVQPFSSKNPFYKENIALFIERNKDGAKFIDCWHILKNGKKTMFIKMVDFDGHEFIKSLDHVLHDSHLVCKECAKKFIDKKHKLSCNAKLLKKIDSRFTLLCNGNDLTTNSDVSVVDHEGYLFNGNVRYFYKGKNPSKFSFGWNRQNLIHNLNNYSMLNGCQSKAIEYINSDNGQMYVKFKCRCGNIFKKAVGKWMDGQDRCSNCSNKQSKYETMVKDFLDNNNIKYIQEFRFNGCRDDLPLPFDFYLTDYNILIEVDGQQHFNPVPFDNDGDMALLRFKKQVEHDSIKTEYCESHNIPLIRISYKEFCSDSWKNKIRAYIDNSKA